MNVGLWEKGITERVLLRTASVLYSEAALCPLSICVTARHTEAANLAWAHTGIHRATQATLCHSSSTAMPHSPVRPPLFSSLTRRASPAAA